MNKPHPSFQEQTPRMNRPSFLFLTPVRTLWRSLVNHLIWESSSRQKAEYLEQCWSDSPGAASSGSSQSQFAAALKLFQQTMTSKPEPEDWKNAASAYSQTWYELTAGKPAENKVRPSSANLPPQ